MKAAPRFAPHVTVFGAGPRRALSLHCTMAFGGAWKGLSKALPDLTLIAPDMPSHGQSPDWNGSDSFGDTVLAGSLDVADAGPMDIIGHSFGAITALRIAQVARERVRSLTLIEPVFFAVALQDAPKTLEAQSTASQAFTEAVDAADMEAAARAFNRMWSADAPPWDRLPERTRAAMIRGVRVVPDTYALLYDDTAGLLGPGGVAEMDIPTLLMRGARARDTIVAVNDGLAARMPQAQQVVIPDAGHMAPISHPEAVAQSLMRFLDGIRSD
ncbi:MAG: alpha/beta hydrolase [Pseudomonadota bacterium]